MAAKRWHVNALPHRKLDRQQAEPLRGRDVRGLQRAVNKIAQAHPRVGITPLKVDGEAGRQTLAMARRAAHCLGLYPGHKTGVSRYVQVRLRNPKLRTKGEKARALKWQKEMRDHREHQLTRVDNSVTGGAPRQRLVFAAMEAARLYASGQARRFYSQAGSWTVERGITGESPGQRSDCSQFVTSMYRSAGLGDPNANGFDGGFTGTMVAHMRQIAREDLMPGDDIVYGDGNGHHTEKWVGNGDGKTPYRKLAAQGSPFRDRTVGHGSPPVDFGDIDMMSGARFFRSADL